MIVSGVEMFKHSVRSTTLVVISKFLEIGRTFSIFQNLFFVSDEQSDSEESNIAGGGGGVNLEKSQKSFYSRFTFSSQSTPTRRYNNHEIKSTRSSSTASETKVTFNEGKIRKYLNVSQFQILLLTKKKNLLQHLMRLQKSVKFLQILCKVR